MYINPQPEYSAADSAITAIIPVYRTLLSKPTRRSARRCLKSCPEMSRVDVMFDDTDSERNAVPITAMRLPGASLAFGIASSISKTMDDADILLT